MDEVDCWLAAWVVAIRSQDYAAGRKLFASDVIAFGSLGEALRGLDDLEARQWRPVWSRTRGFEFEQTTIVSADVESVVCTGRWSSKGHKPDGDWYERRGRATLVLRRREGALLCVHSHFSMDSGVPALILN